MRRIALLLVILIVAGLPVLAQRTVYVSPDVPTDPGIGIDVLPWQAVGHNAGVYGPPIPVLHVPGDPAVDALHRMDKVGNWLFSVEAPSNLGGLLPIFAEPSDVLHYDTLSYNFFFCGGSVAGAVPAGSDVDAIYLEGTDTGDLIVSFDVPTTIGAQTFDPADLVRYTRIGGGCAGWALVGLHWDASLAGSGVSTTSNVIGADEKGGVLVLSFDIPTDLSPPGVPPTFVPGELVSWDGTNYTLWTWLTAWPLNSMVDALTCQGNPGKVYDQWVYQNPIRMNKNVVAGTVTVLWTQSCSAGAEDYGIYEGNLGSWTTHKQKTCTDLLGDLQETFIPQAADSYYLVVPHDKSEEGSFGLDYDSSRVPLYLERPRATNPVDRCVPNWVVTPCP